MVGEGQVTGTSVVGSNGGYSLDLAFALDAAKGI
jgi:hypothetical protein